MGIAENIIKQHEQSPQKEILHPNFAHNQARTEGISLKLSPEIHDDQIGGLYQVMLEHGIHNTLAVINHMQNPHLKDDFHRFLVEYLLEKSILPVRDLTPELLSELTTTLYEVIMPRETENDEKEHKSIKELCQRF